MQAVVVHDDETLGWEERPDPVPGDTELLVDVRGAGLNGADMLQRRGRYPAPPGSPPDIPGMELAGVVAAAGRQVTRFAVGDRVMGLVGGGAQATLAVVDETHVLAVPDRLGWAEAGGFPEVFATAHDALFTQAGLAMGERVLVTGAAGGVGTAGVQLARGTGAHVVAAVRAEAARDQVAELGADEVIDPAAIADHGPYDVVLELVGAATLPAALGALATGGRVVVIGVAGSGAKTEVDLRRLMGLRARISASTLRGRDRPGKAAVVRGLERHVAPLLADGRIAVPVCDTFAMADAEAAYDRFAAGHKFGKIVLVS
ncbi:MAG TPA: zinc-binding dehydrogenase [Acidimicrobiales bacterium]|nr:zinc-binding dehydrogenase [Acidimicrobiales bacterium]